MDTTESTPAENPQGLQLDSDIYALTDKEAEFFKSQTGIQDDEELKQHIIKVQAEAWKVHPYRCIQGFGFTKLKISRLPAYPDLLKLGQTRPGAIFIDIGCCFGNDARKAIADGYPVENVLASDLVTDFWKLGYKLFKDSPETFPVHFIQGDIFNPTHIAPLPPFYSAPPTTRPNLSLLTSLTPLQGYVSAIHTSSFFHLFGEEDQRKVAKSLASLLSPEPGSMIFGSHASQEVSGLRPSRGLRGRNVYCFAPEDWKALWDGEIFQKGTVTVEASLHETFRQDAERDPSTRSKFYLIFWCVKRV